MISDVLHDAVEEIDGYLGNEVYDDVYTEPTRSQIRNLRNAMDEMCAKLDKVPGELGSTAGTTKGRGMSTTTFEAGQRVRFKLSAVGTIRLDEPYRFTDYIAGEGDTGTVYSSPGAMPEGWLLVALDHKHDDGSDLYAPVHPEMIEAA